MADTGINPTTGQSIDVGQATLAANRLDHAHDIVSGLQIRLSGHKDALRSNWDSKAARSFDSVYEAFNNDFTSVLSSLKEMHEKLIKSNVHYTDMTQHQDEVVNRVNSLINHTTNHSGTAQ